MVKKRKSTTIGDIGRVESPKDSIDEEVKEEFQEADQLGRGGSPVLARKLHNYTDRRPALSGGDLDAAWDQADAGDETVGGSNPTPDQDVVDEIGVASGVTYEDDEPLHTADKLARRDKKRWELDPASSEDYGDRLRQPPRAAKNRK